MIRLNLSREPSWLDLGHDVRVRVAPLTTSLMAAARSDPAVAALPEGASNETIAVTMAKALARLVVLEWEGVGDAEGNPVPVTPEGIDALLDPVLALAPFFPFFPHIPFWPSILNPPEEILYIRIFSNLI